MADKLSLATLEVMPTEDLKILRRAIGMVLSLRGETKTKKK